MASVVSSPVGRLSSLPADFLLKALKLKVFVNVKHKSPALRYIYLHDRYAIASDGYLLVKVNLPSEVEGEIFLPPKDRAIGEFLKELEDTPVALRQEEDKLIAELPHGEVFFGKTLEGYEYAPYQKLEGFSSDFRFTIPEEELKEVRSFFRAVDSLRHSWAVYEIEGSTLRISVEELYPDGVTGEIEIRVEGRKGEPVRFEGWAGIVDKLFRYIELDVIDVGSALEKPMLRVKGRFRGMECVAYAVLGETT